MKIWKDIGMTHKNEDSSFIMIDDKRFDPIWDYIESQNKTLVNHVGEPKNCWLPLSEMTVFGDSSYFAEHPEFHMYLHPEYPSHEELMASRNRVLDKHPDMRYVGCHLGSLEYDVDEQAKFLEKYPNASLDMAARISHFKVQNHNKVRDYIIKYQDRLLYGTDIVLYDGKNKGATLEKMKRRFEDVYRNDWIYFTSSTLLKQKDKVKEYQGLKLPINVLEKIYYKNALRMYPGLGE